MAALTPQGSLMMNGAGFVLFGPPSESSVTGRRHRHWFENLLRTPQERHKLRHDIFLSHSSGDLGNATWIAKVMRLAGADVWVANQDASPGEQWQSGLHEALAECKGIAVLGDARQPHKSLGDHGVGRRMGTDQACVTNPPSLPGIESAGSPQQAAGDRHASVT